MSHHACHTSDFGAHFPGNVQAGRPARPIGAATWRIATTLRMLCESLVEAPAAHRTYEHLKSHGLPHDAALRQALGVAQSDT